MTKKPSVSVILPVLREAGSINEVVAHIRAQDPDGSAEIIVIDGDLTGGTINAALVNGLILAVSRQGRARQMNRGAEMASGEILLFLHSDTLLPAQALARINLAMKDEHIVGGAFELGIASDRRIFRITEWYVALRTRLTKMPFGDQAIFIRRDYFEKLGGYKDIPLMEDVELMARIKKRGGRICVIPVKVMTSARRWEREGIVYCTLRNWMLQILYALGVAPERLVKWYRSP
jgi:rSAM/selenodomain-associated transferase 2